MSRCARCEALPEPLPESGTLFIAPPLAHTGATVRSALERAGFDVTEAAPNVVSVAVRAGSLATVADALAASLGRAELRDARSLLLPEAASLSIADLARMQPLVALVGRARGDWLREIIRGDRLVTHFQPIVRADDPSEVFAHEGLLRGIGPDGGVISPGVLYDAARAADLIFPLDRAARLRAIRAAVEARLPGLIFINFNPTSVYDPAFCLRTTVAAIDDAGIAPGRIVFEVVESDEPHPDLPRIVRYYRDAGFRVALDDLGAGFGSLNLLTELRPDFVKLDMRLVRDVDRDPYKAGILAKLLEMARDLGVGTIAEGIETEAESAWVHDHGVDYLQGYLIARPAFPPTAPGPAAPRRRRAALARA